LLKKSTNNFRSLGFGGLGSDQPRTLERMLTAATFTLDQDLPVQNMAGDSPKGLSLVLLCRVCQAARLFPSVTPAEGIAAGGRK
jgi:hypothetical protein